jgi:hypothetical protein
MRRLNLSREAAQKMRPISNREERASGLMAARHGGRKAMDNRTFRFCEPSHISKNLCASIHSAPKCFDIPVNAGLCD